MDNDFTNQEETRGAQTTNSLSQSIKTLKNAYNITKRVVNIGKMLVGGFPIWGVVVIIILIIASLFLFTLNFGLSAPIPGGSYPTSSGNNSTLTPNIPGLTIILTGPSSISNGVDIPYQITVRYDPSKATVPLSDIVLFDTVPNGTEFVNASGNYQNTGATIEWSLSTSAIQNPFTITLHPKNPDTYITNTVSARLNNTTNGNSQSAPGSNSGGSYPASITTCSGTYNLNAIPGGLNFGDPGCNFTKDQLYTILQQLDPQNANKWYHEIIPCESGYNPNAYNPNSESKLGAYGLFQMNPQGRGNGQYDAGNVEWSTQISNAVSYNGEIGGSFAYWGCNKSS